MAPRLFHLLVRNSSCSEKPLPLGTVVRRCLLSVSAAVYKSAVGIEPSLHPKFQPPANSPESDRARPRRYCAARIGVR
jgi:hypothetical protein